ncbi:MAG TPA: transposase [Verrucomicrobiae bacterium]|nr:transposase [Verrucomicrobiae bacterium]
MDSKRVFFITTITAQRMPIFRRDSTARLLIDTLAHYRDQGRYLLHEFVIMPDHLHALLTPGEAVSVERAMQFIKGGFSFRLKQRGRVWQASFTNHRVRDLEDYERHREYIRMNPVRARLAARPDQYPYSSAADNLRIDPVPPGLNLRSLEANSGLKARSSTVVQTTVADSPSEFSTTEW